MSSMLVKHINPLKLVEQLRDALQLLLGLQKSKDLNLSSIKRQLAVLESLPEISDTTAESITKLRDQIKQSSRAGLISRVEIYKKNKGIERSFRELSNACRFLVDTKFNFESVFTLDQYFSMFSPTSEGYGIKTDYTAEQLQSYKQYLQAFVEKQGERYLLGNEMYLQVVNQHTHAVLTLNAINLLRSATPEEGDVSISSLLEIYIRYAIQDSQPGSAFRSKIADKIFETLGPHLKIRNEPKILAKAIQALKSDTDLPVQYAESVKDLLDSSLGYEIGIDAKAIFTSLNQQKRSQEQLSVSSHQDLQICKTTVQNILKRGHKLTNVFTFKQYQSTFKNPGEEAPCFGDYFQYLLKTAKSDPTSTTETETQLRAMSPVPHRDEARVSIPDETHAKKVERLKTARDASRLSEAQVRAHAAESDQTVPEEFKAAPKPEPVIKPEKFTDREYTTLQMRVFPHKATQVLKAVVLNFQKQRRVQELKNSVLLDTAKNLLSGTHSYSELTNTQESDLISRLSKILDVKCYSKSDVEEFKTSLAMLTKFEDFLGAQRKGNSAFGRLARRFKGSESKFNQYFNGYCAQLKTEWDTILSPDSDSSSISSGDFSDDSSVGIDSPTREHSKARTSTAWMNTTSKLKGRKLNFNKTVTQRLLPPESPVF